MALRDLAGYCVRVTLVAAEPDFVFRPMAVAEPALHYLVGGRLHLHWLRDRIATLPRENRWQAMARAALRDDLFSLHAELTADVLRGTGPDVVGGEARLDEWLEANRPLVERCLGILSDIRTGGTYDLTTLPVALRELRNLIQAAAAAGGAAMS